MVQIRPALYHRVYGKVAILQYFPIHTDLETIEVVCSTCVPERRGRRDRDAPLSFNPLDIVKSVVRIGQRQRQKRVLGLEVAFKVFMQLKPAKSGQYAYPVGQFMLHVDFRIIKFRGVIPYH